MVPVFTFLGTGAVVTAIPTGIFINKLSEYTHTGTIQYNTHYWYAKFNIFLERKFTIYLFSPLKQYINITSLTLPFFYAFLILMHFRTKDMGLHRR